MLYQPKSAMFRYQDMLNEINRCCGYAASVRNQATPALTSNGMMVSPLTAYCFRIAWPGSSVGVSVSVPVDANQHADAYGWVLETALWANGTVTYMDEVGYDDVCRFETVGELVADVLRVKEYFTTHPYDDQQDGLDDATPPDGAAPQDGLDDQPNELVDEFTTPSFGPPGGPPLVFD